MKQSKISDLLDKISNKINNPDFPELAKIEHELLMQHVRELYDELDSLKSLKNTTVNEEAGKTQPVASDKNIHESLNIKKTFHANQNLLLNEVTPKKEEEKKSGQAATNNVMREETATKPAVQSMNGSKTASLNESVNLSESLNEKLKSNSLKEVHKKLASKPLKDLIDLNKRFVLLNELFKGNAEAFSAAVNHIDSLNDYPSAETFIQTQLVSNYYWDESSPTAMLFMKLVKQKFGVE